MDKVLEITIADQNQIGDSAKALLNCFGDRKIIFFNAPMGAGKTTLIKEICTALGSRDDFSSPTFSIVNEYSYPGGKIFHFDLYRLKDQEELFDIGIEEYLDSGNYCFFEWPELVMDMIKINFVTIEIDVKENIRYLRIIKN